MWRALQIVTCVVLVATSACAAELVDRVIARVGHQVVLQSEFDDALHYQALSTGRAPESFSEAERREAFEDLVDQALIQEQIAHSNYVPATKQDIERQIGDIRRQVPGAESNDNWHKLLERYGFTPGDFAACVARSLNILRYLDARFRPSVHIDPRQVQAYYREQFLPQLRKAGAQDAPLEQVEGRIEEILVQQAVNDETFDWLEELRREANLPPHPREQTP